MPHHSWIRTYLALSLFMLPFGAGALALSWTTQNPVLLGMAFLLLTCFMFTMMLGTDRHRYRVDAHEVDGLIAYANAGGISHKRFMQIFAEVSTKRVDLQAFMSYGEYRDIKATIDREIGDAKSKGVVQ